MSALRILIVSRSLPFHGIGGMEAVAWDLARSFAASGADVRVLTTRCAALPAERLVEGVRILPLDVPSGRYSAAWWRESRAAFARLAPMTDVVFSVSAGARAMVRDRSGPHPVFVLQAHGTAWGELVSKIRQMRPKAWASSVRNLKAMVDDLAYRRFDAVVAVGDVVARDLQRQPTRAIIGALPVHVIPNGVDPAVFAFSAADRARLRAGLGLDSAARVVLSASRLHPQKGVAEGMAGFQRAARQDPRLHLVIAGDGPDAARLKALAAASGLEARIHFTGHVQRDAMRAWLSAADLFLFTTKRVEVGLTMNILEARAAGLPVVASPHVLDARFGALAALPGDPEAIAAAILAGLPDVPPYAARPSLLAEDFTLNHTAAAYLRLFATMIEGMRS